MAEPQIISNSMDGGLMYTVGERIYPECVVKNIGDAGIIKIQMGLGYINKYDNQTYFTGKVITGNIDFLEGQSKRLYGSFEVQLTDYYAQDGVGWAYEPVQIYLFFILDGANTYTERHIRVYLEAPEGYKDPTSLPEILPDIIPGDWREPEPHIPEPGTKPPKDMGEGFGFGKVIFKFPDVKKWLKNEIVDYILKR